VQDGALVEDGGQSIKLVGGWQSGPKEASLSRSGWRWEKGVCVFMFIYTSFTCGEEREGERELCVKSSRTKQPLLRTWQVSRAVHALPLFSRVENNPTCETCACM
ncbi:unnamed protein product, partial [Discosporangium mesarthrocarpum]